MKRLFLNFLPLKFGYNALPKFTLFRTSSIWVCSLLWTGWNCCCYEEWWETGTWKARLTLWAGEVTVISFWFFLHWASFGLYHVEFTPIQSTIYIFFSWRSSTLMDMKSFWWRQVLLVLVVKGLGSENWSTAGF